MSIRRRWTIPGSLVNPKKVDASSSDRIASAAQIDFVDQFGWRVVYYLTSHPIPSRPTIVRASAKHDWRYSHHGSCAAIQ
eukprot:scaffold2299_cov56-Attheya_sp.AAC.2